MFNESFQLIINKLIKETCNEESLKNYLKLDREHFNSEGQTPSQIALGLVTVCCATMLRGAIESAEGKFTKEQERKFDKVVEEASKAVIPYTKDVTLEDLSVNKKRFFECVEAGIIAFQTYMALNYFK